MATLGAPKAAAPPVLCHDANDPPDQFQSLTEGSWAF